MIGLRILCLAIGYLFGNFQTAYILGKMKGIDIRDFGSGNAGTTNAIRVLGTKAGLLVFVGDMLKSLIALLLVGALFGKSHPEAVLLLKSWAFMGVVLGHDFPFYMNFKGGKGVAVMAGFAFGYHWSFIPSSILLFFVPYLTTKFVSLGSLMVYGGTFIQMVIGDPVLPDLYGLLQAQSKPRKTAERHGEKDLSLQGQFRETGSWQEVIDLNGCMI